MNDLVSFVEAESNVINIVLHNWFWSGSHSWKYIQNAKANAFKLMRNLDDDQMLEIYQIQKHITMISPNSQLVIKWDVFEIAKT